MYIVHGRQKEPKFYGASGLIKIIETLVWKNNFRSTTGDPFDQGFSKLRGVLGLMIPQHLGALGLTSGNFFSSQFCFSNSTQDSSSEVKALSRLELESV